MSNFGHSLTGRAKLKSRRLDSPSHTNLSWASPSLRERTFTNRAIIYKATDDTFSASPYLTLRPQHRGLDRAQDLKLGRYRGDPLAHLEQVGADPLVGALPRQLLGDPGDVVAGVGDGLRRRNQLPLAALVVVVDQLGEAGHQHGHPLGGGDEVVVLGGPLAHLAVQIVGGDLRTKTKQRVESRG